MIKRGENYYWYWLILLITTLVISILFFEYGESLGKAMAD